MATIGGRPWTRIGLEAATIVGSILLAFSVDACWAEQQLRRDEQVLLDGLQGDFVASRAALDVAIASLERFQARFAQFENSTPEGLAAFAPDAISSTMNAFQSGLTYDPAVATLEAAASDGRVSLIRNQDLKRVLATWQRALTDLEENHADVRAQTLRVIRSAERHGGPFHNGALSEDDRATLPVATAETLAALRQDPVYVGEVRSRMYSVAFYLRELRPLAQTIDSTLVLVEASRD